MYSLSNQTLIFEVFSCLEKSDKVIQDDTQLEKLYNLLETSIHDYTLAASFLSHSEVSDFFKYAANGRQQDPFQALILALRLGPHLYCVGFGSKPDDVPIWVDVVFHSAVTTEHVWENGSVRNAWVLGLTTMCRTSNGLCWGLKKGYLLKAVDCVFDPSIFVSNQAHSLIATVIPELLQVIFPSKQNLLDCDLSKDVWNKLVTLINGVLIPTGYNPTRVTSALIVIRGVCKVAPVHARRMLGFTETVCGFAEKAQIWNDRVLTHQVITTLIEVLALSAEDISIHQRVEYLASHLIHKNICSAMSLSSKLLKSGNCIAPDRLREIIMLPVKLLLEDTIHNVDMTTVQHVEQVFQDTAYATKVILNSVNLLVSWTGDDQVAVAHMLSRILALTFGNDVKKASVGNVTGLRIAVYHNTKLQLAILDVLMKILQLDEAANGSLHGDLLIQLFMHCIVMLKRPGLPVTLSMKAYAWLGNILHVLEDVGHEWLHQARDQSCGDTTRQIGDVLDNTSLVPLDEFADLLRYAVCDIRWEVRDTGVSTIGKIIQEAKPGGLVVVWLEKHKLAQQVWQSVSDGESYVRAGSIKSLTYLPKQISLWQQLLAYCPQDEIVMKLITILAEDTEAFARRSTIDLLCNWLKMSVIPEHNQTILTAFNFASNDLDWEVKLTLLEFWAGIIEKKLSDFETFDARSPCGSKHKLKERLQESLFKHMDKLKDDGCLRCLITGARDYDRSVQCRACEILVMIRDICILHELTAPVCRTKSSDAVTNAKLRCFQNGSGDQSCGGLDYRLGSSEQLTVEVFLEELEGLDLDQLLIESRKSIDDYVQNPESLFEDILTSLKKDDEENAIDCY